MALLALVRQKRRHGALILLGLFGTALLYGDGIITPAISVLSAAEGIEVAAPAFKHFVAAGHAAGPVPPVLLPALWDRAARRRVRSDHARLVRDHRRARRDGDRPGAGNPIGAEPVVRHHALRRSRRRGLPRARRGRARRHRRGGALRGPGSFRPRTDPPRLVRRRVAGPPAQLLRSGSGDPTHPRRSREPLLSDGSADLSLSAGGHRDRGHRRGLAGPDLRGVLTDVPVRPASLQPARVDRAHLRAPRWARSTSRRSMPRS